MRQAHGCTKSIDPAQRKMPRELARDNLSPHNAAGIAAQRRTASCLTRRPSYKSSSVRVWLGPVGLLGAGLPDGNAETVAGSALAAVVIATSPG